MPVGSASWTRNCVPLDHLAAWFVPCKLTDLSHCRRTQERNSFLLSLLLLPTELKKVWTVKTLFLFIEFFFFHIILKQLSPFVSCLFLRSFRALNGLWNSLGNLLGWAWHNQREFSYMGPLGAPKPHWWGPWPRAVVALSFQWAELISSRLLLEIQRKSCLRLVGLFSLM